MDGQANDVALEAEVVRLHDEFRRRIEQARNILAGVEQDSVRQLRHDLGDPALTSPTSLADDFMIKANQAGLALIEQGFLTQAAQLYRALETITTEYAAESQQPRHIGALLANLGAVHLVQGNLDQGVEYYLHAAESDAVTYNIGRDQSYALTNLLENGFATPTTREALQLARNGNPAITESRIRTLRTALGDLELAFLASVHQIWTQVHGHQPSTIFGRLQLFSGIRNLSVLFEIRVKSAASVTGTTLLPALEELYGTEPWWHSFKERSKEIGATWKSRVPNETRLQRALKIPEVDPVGQSTTPWKSLLVSYVVRNYVAHDMETECKLVTDRSITLQSVGHVLNGMLLVSNL